jgi:hypothetical protein
MIFLYVAAAGIISHSKLKEIRAKAGSLSYSQVQVELSGKKVISPNCDKISSCALESGDILLRRHLTDRTKLFDIVFNPYYTHTAFYLGDGYIVEAQGSEKNKRDDVIKEKLSDSDWYNSNIYEWVILRPAYTGNQLSEINQELVVIANDDTYTFGLPHAKNGSTEQRTYCSLLIYSELVKHAIIRAGPDESFKIITPDYLFNAVLKERDSSIIGYSFR